MYKIKNNRLDGDFYIGAEWSGLVLGTKKDCNVFMIRSKYVNPPKLLLRSEYTIHEEELTITPEMISSITDYRVIAPIIGTIFTHYGEIDPHERVKFMWRIIIRKDVVKCDLTSIIGITATESDDRLIYGFNANYIGWILKRLRYTDPIQCCMINPECATLIFYHNKEVAALLGGYRI